LTDSELILTQLSAEGYETSKTFEGADIVIVNTCGFIDDAVKESLDTIGEALAANGRVIVTGCLGVEEQMIRDTHPSVLAVTGPHQYEDVVNAVNTHLPPGPGFGPPPADLVIGSPDCAGGRVSVWTLGHASRDLDERPRAPLDVVWKSWNPPGL